MRSTRAIFLSCLLALGTLCAAQSAHESSVNPAGHLRGKKHGNYTLKLVGQYSGQGRSVITFTAVSITAKIKAPNGGAGDISFNNMPLIGDHFQGVTSFNGVNINISGRVDMPSGTDREQTKDQKMTGRITAQLIDATGKGARLVAIEDPASRALILIP
jgi:hypothetical protein